MTLVTSFPLYGQQWDILFMPIHMLQLVEKIIFTQKQPVMKNGASNYEWGPVIPIEDEHQSEIEDGLSVQL